MLSEEVSHFADGVDESGKIASLSELGENDLDDAIPRGVADFLVDAFVSQDDDLSLLDDDADEDGVSEFGLSESESGEFGDGGFPGVALGVFEHDDFKFGASLFFELGDSATKLLSFLRRELKGWRHDDSPTSCRMHRRRRNFLLRRR